MLWHIVVGTLLIYHFGLAQMWRCFPKLAAIPFTVGMSTVVLVVVSSIGLGAHISRRLSGDAVATTTAKDRGALFLRLIIFCVGCAAYFLWSWPQIGFGLHNFGDEDFHFATSTATHEYLMTFIRGSVFDGTAPNILRYPGLMYLLFGVFPNLTPPSQGGADPLTFAIWQRLPLIVPFLIMPQVLFGQALRMQTGRTTALLLGCVCATAPSYLAYTSDKYLDIGHPVLFALWGFHMIQAFRGSSRDALFASYASALLPLVRDNAMPTSLISGASLFLLYAWRHRYFFAAYLGAFSVLPGMIYVAAKTFNSSVDTNRLSLSYIPQQDFLIFFQTVPYHIPLVAMVFSVIALGWARKADACAALCISASLAGQLLIYAMFEPKWMPWSRNYLMFSGQCIALATLGVSVLSRRTPRARSIFNVIAVASIAFNIVVDERELGRNIVFHENEIIYSYSDLFRFLKESPFVAKPARIEISVPVELATSYRVQTVPEGITFVPVYADGKGPGWPSFMPWKAFREHLPADTSYVVFHYRNSHPLAPATRPVKVARPTSEELGEYEVLQDFVDPRSQGENGLLLLARRLPRGTIEGGEPQALGELHR